MKYYIRLFRARLGKICVHWTDGTCKGKNLTGVEFIRDDGVTHIAVYCPKHLKAIKKNFKTLKVDL